MLSGGKKCYQVRNVIRRLEMLSVGKKCYQEVTNVIWWEVILLGG